MSEINIEIHVVEAETAPALDEFHSDSHQFPVRSTPAKTFSDRDIDIDIIMGQTGCTAELAETELRNCNGDLVAAILRCGR
jgi:NACalpha-BTF3-like transcription factor